MYTAIEAGRDKHFVQAAMNRLSYDDRQYRIDIINAHGEVIGCTDFISDALFAVRWHRMNGTKAYINVHYDAKEISHPRY
jgi:hypothetical protein